MSMKRLYKKLFERNSDRLKDLRYQYVQVKHGYSFYFTINTVVQDSKCDMSYSMFAMAIELYSKPCPTYTFDLL